MQRLHALQYLRAFAAFIVVYSHATLQVPEWQSVLPATGTYGVDIFFVISGFIMVYITKPTNTPKQFIKNRIRRVVPLYWFFTLLMALVLFFVPSVFKTGEFQWHTVLQSLFFIPHYSIQNPSYIWPIVAPGWSLNYEMYFYTTFALSLFLPQRFRVAMVIGCIGTLWLLATISGSQIAILRFLAEPSVFEFIAGMLLAVLWQQGFQLTPRIAWVFVFAGLVWATFAPEHLHHWISISLPSTLIVFGCLYLALPNNRVGTLLGDASYALYLSHIFVLGALRSWLQDGATESALQAWGFVILAIVCTTLVGIVVHLLVDNWLLREERLLFLKSGRPEQEST